jgi:hypothetical protein
MSFLYVERNLRRQVVPPEKEHNMPIRFGASDTPKCPKCKNIMRLSRRAPHPTRGEDFELQSFRCWICHQEMEREADIGGEVAA